MPFTFNIKTGRRFSGKHVMTTYDADVMLLAAAHGRTIERDLEKLMDEDKVAPLTRKVVHYLIGRRRQSAYGSQIVAAAEAYKRLAERIRKWEILRDEIRAQAY